MLRVRSSPPLQIRFKVLIALSFDTVPINPLQYRCCIGGKIELKGKPCQGSHRGEDRGHAPSTGRPYSSANLNRVLRRLLTKAGLDTHVQPANLMRFAT